MARELHKLLVCWNMLNVHLGQLVVGSRGYGSSEGKIIVAAGTDRLI